MNNNVHNQHFPNAQPRRAAYNQNKIIIMKNFKFAVIIIVVINFIIIINCLKISFVIPKFNLAMIIVVIIIIIFIINLIII